MDNHHIHTGAIAIVGTLAIVFAAQFLIRTWGAKHSDNPAVAGLVYGF